MSWNRVLAVVVGLGLLVSSGMLGGCKPSRANTALRKENALLREDLVKGQKQRDADLSRLRELETGTTRPVVTQEKLDRLFTAQGLRFGKLTGGYRNDPAGNVDDGIVVHVVPTDQEGQDLKAAGRFSVYVFDLDRPDQPLVVSRAFTLDESMKAWNGYAMLYNYVLKVPFAGAVTHSKLRVRVDFFDELSSRRLTAERDVTVASGH